jgi:peptidoglycan/LPS O-acetylase OafA/YrhL
MAIVLLRGSDARAIKFSHIVLDGVEGSKTNSNVHQLLQLENRNRSVAAPGGSIRHQTRNHPGGCRLKQEQPGHDGHPEPALTNQMGDGLSISVTSTASGSGKFLSLEGLRGVLALLVCIGHLGLNTVTNKIGVTVRFGLSVDVFFALSGFVLCYSNYFGRRSFHRFVVGRFARLYPIHALTLVAMTLIYLALERQVDAWQFVQQVFLVHNIGLWPNRLPPNFPNWSISVEFWISILFFIALQTRRFRLPILLLVAMIPAALMTKFIDGDAQNAFSIVNLGLLRGIIGFSVGSAAFLVFERIGDKIILPSFAVYVLLVMLGAFFLLEDWTRTTVILFYAVLLVCLTSLAANDHATILSSRPFVMLGAISYSIYLLHIPIYSALSLAIGDGLSRGSTKFFLLLVVLTVSYLSYRWIERPSQRIILKTLGAETISNRSSPTR